MRLTLDLDDVSENRARQKALLLAVMFPGRRVKYRISASKKGAHVVVHDCGLSWDDICAYRFLLGDDPRRIAIDQRPGKPLQVLFSKKYGMNAGEWHYVC